MRQSTDRRTAFWGVTALLVTCPLVAGAQVPVDEQGVPLEATIADDTIPLLSVAELEELVGPVALYPDDLLAVVLPASTYPLQVVQAARFLEQLEDDPSLQPDETWNDAIVALLNYPEVVELLADDIDWTWRLGEAVVAQQDDVIAAVESFRDRAYAAGNLASDEYQTVTENEGVIHIEPVDEEVIYVPYYEPQEVVVYQPRPVYYYYPDPCPVYYYPYSSNYAFRRGYFWGVTTAFTVGWFTNRLHVYHPTYYGHPYYGSYYWGSWWYRRPNVSVYNNTYVNYGGNYYGDRYRNGDYWRPHNRRSVSVSNRRVTRSHYYPGSSGYQEREAVPRHRSSSYSRNLTGSADRNSVRREDSARRAPQANTRQPSRQARDSLSRNERRSDANRQASRSGSTSTRTPQRSDSQRNQPRRSEPQPRRSESRRDPVARNETTRPTQRSGNSNRRTPAAQPRAERSPSREPSIRRNDSYRSPVARNDRSSRRSESRNSPMARNDAPRQSRSSGSRSESRRSSSNRSSSNRSSSNRSSSGSSNSKKSESRSSKSSSSNRSQRDARRRR